MQSPDVNSTFLALLVLAVGLCPAHVFATRLAFDIPGDGVITCGPNSSFQPVCPGGVGSVSASFGKLTGSLRQGGSDLGIDLGQNRTLLTFNVEPPGSNNPPGYDPQLVGPLGLNPLFQPSATHVGSVGLPSNLPPSLAYLDATVPVAGQPITLSVTNVGSTSLTGISFFLGRNVNTLSTVSTPQDDGLTFGLYCSGKTHAQGTPDDCALPANWKLLLTPYGSGVLDPADTNSSNGTFGDVLRFNSLDLAPGQVGQFKFFLTDNSSTRTPPGGVFTPANQSFVLDIEPEVQAVPEPGMAKLFGGVIVLLFAAKSTWAIARAQLLARCLAIFHPVAKVRIQD